MPACYSRDVLFFPFYAVWQIFAVLFFQLVSATPKFKDAVPGYPVNYCFPGVFHPLALARIWTPEEREPTAFCHCGPPFFSFLAVRFYAYLWEPNST